MGKTIRQRIVEVWTEGELEPVFIKKPLWEAVCAKGKAVKDSSVIPTDYCVNLINAGDGVFEDILFERIVIGEFRCVKWEKYSGEVYWRPRKKDWPEQFTLEYWQDKAVPNKAVLSCVETAYKLKAIKVAEWTDGMLKINTPVGFVLNENEFENGKKVYDKLTAKIV